jgi:translation initiation factor IF-3
LKKTFRPHPRPGAKKAIIVEIKSNSGKQRINEDINEPEIRVVDEQGAMLGIMSSRKAQEIARERELDLIEIAPQAKPPVCKIMDYGKFQYELQKKEKHQRKHQQQQQMKEIRFKWRTATHDFNFKVRHARDFITDGNKVKASVMFRGREITHQEVGHELLSRFVEAMKDIAKVDQKVQSEGRFISVVLAPDKAKKIKKEEGSSKDDNIIETKTEETQK